MQVNTLDAKNQLSRLIDAALAGEEVVIARRGKPAVRLQRIPQDGEIDETPGNPAWIAQWFKENPINPAWAISDEESAAWIREERDAWD
ncbi:MAG: type II toxin-antitoxin system prevent-host-death family antitoxin [Thermoleophilaceae bacterium]|nr:type II toxin-antitoxin system prevent-host-death family antitoxin [Thermoleophilaceae bacterium]